MRETMHALAKPKVEFQLHFDESSLSSELSFDKFELVGILCQFETSAFYKM